jgi:hypothetical protein
MKVLTVRNVHEALPRALRLLDQVGIERPSRNGPVKQAPWPVTTVYERPCERVLFWPERDANPFFHLYESLWMLAGRNDILPLTRYAKNMANYSDDGKIQHGAYGFRWRKHFDIDQLEDIANGLRQNVEDRRCVLQMYDAESDSTTVYESGKDVPCNTMATFQIGIDGRLDLTVFCRSNDIVWGAYGANAVHFSMLLEYMANWIGCPVGVYRQVSVNWHGYLTTVTPMLPLVNQIGKYNDIANPYTDGTQTRPIPIEGEIRRVDELIASILADADAGFVQAEPPEELWAKAAWYVLRAHDCWRTMAAPHRFNAALEDLDRAPATSDWVQAAQQWIRRRQTVWLAKQ